MKKRFLKAVLSAGNELRLNELLPQKDGLHHYTPLLTIVAQALDEAAQGDNVWVSIGKTRDQSSLTLVVHTEEGALTAFAESMEGLSTACRDLL